MYRANQHAHSQLSFGSVSQEGGFHDNVDEKSNHLKLKKKKTLLPLNLQIYCIYEFVECGVNKTK